MPISKTALDRLLNPTAEDREAATRWLIENGLKSELQAIQERTGLDREGALWRLVADRMVSERMKPNTTTKASD